jgi:cation transport regulator ChaB
MSDPIPNPPAPEPQPSKRSQSPIDKKITYELDLTERLVATAQKAPYTAGLADEEIDATFLANVTAQIAAADKLIGDASGDNADKATATLAEAKAQKVLLGHISKIQKRAKRKYTPGNPGRNKYFIGDNIDSSRHMLETSTSTIVQNVTADTLPGHKPADTAALAAALQDYKDTKGDQSGDASDALTAHALLVAKVKDIAGLRRQIQYAADTVWPPGDPANVGARKAFSLPPNIALK